MVSLNSGAAGEIQTMPLIVFRHPQSGRICASVASQSRAAFSATVSNTGWISVGELAITLRISLVAVCCSRDSFNSVKSRTFSMAMTAWEANVLRSAICLSEKGRDFGSPILKIAPIATSSRSNGHQESMNTEWFRKSIAFSGNSA